MLHEVAEQVEWYGQKIDAEDWKDMFTASLRHARVVPGIDKGTFVPLGMHTSTMTIEEMSNLIELVYAFGAEHGVTFKEPQQPNSGGAPSTPDKAEDSSPDPSASDEPEDDNAQSSGSFTILDCAKEFLALAVVKWTDEGERDEAFEQGKADWMKRLPAELHPQIESIRVSTRAVATGKRTVAQAKSWLCEVLECKPEDLA
ncbi:hypothetical protein ABID21_001875 [Pseudorhizobium tarimense]|uniref:Uncharacterized protein n=2 Tax=Pseudorhizobium tarimense TaxID=1079109 RepID=A0ABV2H5J6_9HYPH